MTFEVRVAARGDVDGAIAELGRARIERSAGRVFVTCEGVPERTAVALLARAGLAATSAAPLLVPSQRSAIVSHLRPVALDGVHDVLSVRCASLGEAIDLVRAETRDVLGRRAGERRARLALLLHERDRVLLWRRVVHAPFALLRSRAIPGARPIVFDPNGAQHAAERLAFASAGALAAWIA